MADKYEVTARELFDSISNERDEWTRNRRIDRIAAALRAAAEEERRAHAETLDLLLRVRASTQGQLISDPFASDLDEHLVKHLPFMRRFLRRLVREAVRKANRIAKEMVP